MAVAEAKAPAWPARDDARMSAPANRLLNRSADNRGSGLIARRFCLTGIPLSAMGDRRFGILETVRPGNLNDGIPHDNRSPDFQPCFSITGRAASASGYRPICRPETKMTFIRGQCVRV
jgi:hypothetical protein